MLFSLVTLTSLSLIKSHMIWCTQPVSCSSLISTVFSFPSSSSCCPYKTYTNQQQNLEDTESTLNLCMLEKMQCCLPFLLIFIPQTGLKYFIFVGSIANCNCNLHGNIMKCNRLNKNMRNNFWSWIRRYTDDVTWPYLKYTDKGLY